MVKKILFAQCMLWSGVHAQTTPNFPPLVPANSTGLPGKLDNWNFGLRTAASFGLNSNESSLFRGSGIAAGMTGDYFFGLMGIGMHGGFMNSKLSTTAINQFMVEQKFPPTTTVNTTAAQNAFLLLGPSLRLGNKVQVIASAKAGLFLNQSGGLTIGQQGAARPLYRFEAADKNMYPGFNGALSFSYPIGGTSALQLTTELFRSSASVMLYNPQQGIDVPVEQKRNIQTINAGISFVKTFGAKSRETGSGMATGRRQRSAAADGGYHENGRVVKTKTRSNQSNDRMVQAPGELDEVSIINPEQKRVQKTKTRSNQSNDRMANAGCGPVTLETRMPDGTTAVQTFSCPEDAVQFQRKLGNMPNRISMNFTTAKQTGNRGFGEKVNQGLSTGGAFIISGRIVRNTGGLNNAGGIVANGSGLKTNSPVADVHGVVARLYARDKNNGLATGKRSASDGGGLPTGRRQYAPLFVDGQPQGDMCNPCLAEIKNPLYQEKGNGPNPVYETKRIGGGIDNDCDGLAEGLDVFLTDRRTGATLATTKTNRCGQYWFANVPAGNFSVAISGSFASKKGYDYYQAQSQKNVDVAGEITAPAETWQHFVFDNNNSSSPQMKAGISTSRSKIRRGLTVVLGDSDGDGQADFYRGILMQSDGSSKQIAEGRLSMNTSSIIIPFDQNNQLKTGVNTSRSNIRNFTVTLADFSMKSVFADGTTRDVSHMVEWKQQPGITQVQVAVGDVDGDGAADLIWSPRSNVGITARETAFNLNTLPASALPGDNNWVRHLPLSIADVDGDGRSEIVIGNGPGEILMPGEPMQGFSVKMKNGTGGETVGEKITNGLGEFEFPNLSPGNYAIEMDATFVLEDQVDIDLHIDDDTMQLRPGSPIGGLAIKGGRNYPDMDSLMNRTIPGVTGGTSPGTKVQDHNSSRSNKSSSIIAPDFDKTDSTGVNQLWAQNNNTVRSNRTDNAIAVTNDLLDELTTIEAMLDAGPNQTKAGISTSRSNIRRSRTHLSEVQEYLQVNDFTGAKAAWNKVSPLLSSLAKTLPQVNGNFSSVSNVLKTKHDTVKNSISNIR